MLTNPPNLSPDLLVTHPHPDHYAGAARLLEGLDVPIVATVAVDAVIRRDDAEKNAVVGPMMGEAWPQSRRFPDAIVAVGERRRAGGLTFNVTTSDRANPMPTPCGCSTSQTVFVGDVAYNDMHSYLADGRYVEWLAALDRLGNVLPADATLYLGHGAPVGIDALAVAAPLRRAFLAAVTVASGLDAETGRTEVVDAMRAIVPGDRLLFLMELSIEPVLATLVGRGL